MSRATAKTKQKEEVNNMIAVTSTRHKDMMIYMTRDRAAEALELTRIELDEFLNKGGSPYPHIIIKEYGADFKVSDYKKLKERR